MSGQALSLLWIDDEVPTVQGALETLEAEDHRVFVAEDLASARDVLRTTALHAVCLDVCLGSDRTAGTELLSELTAGDLGETNANTPVVFVTASGPDPSFSYGDGVAGWLTKSGPLVHDLRSLLGNIVVEPVLSDTAGKLLTPEDPAFAELTTVLRSASERIYDQVRDDPLLLPSLSGREFEQFVAEALRRDGFDVTLTRASGDRGVDIYAVRHTGLGSLLYVVECKRHDVRRPIKAGLVRELRGVIDRERATAGMLATTSFFSQAAIDEQRKLPFRIALRDLDDIRRWLAGKRVW